MRVLTACGICLAFFPPSVWAGDTPAYNEDLILWYAFNDVSDGVVKDATGNGRDGRVFGAKRARGRKGIKRKALRFDGIDDFVRVPLHLGSTALPRMTVTFWVKSEGEAFRETLVSNDLGRMPTYGRTLAISKSRNTGKRYFVAWYGDTSLNDGAEILSDEWYFVAVSYDHKSAEVGLFVDGRYKKIVGVAGEGEPHFFIGAHPDQDRWFNGAIEDFRVYERVLTFEELDAMFTGQVR